MSIRSVLFGILQANNDVAALVGTRIYALTLPENPVFPAITGQIISGLDSRLNHSGSTGIEEGSVQLDLYSESLAEVHDLRKKVETALRSLSGSYSGTRINFLRKTRTTELHEPDLGEYRISLDFEISFKEQ